MKLEITMKDPDTLHDELRDAEDELAAKLKADLGLTDEGATAEAEARMEGMRELAAKFFEYSEYITIVLDDETKTATVKPIK